MKSTSIATMALRLAAVYCWLQVLLGSTFLARIWMTDDPQARPWFGAEGIALTATAVLGLALWILSGRWAHRILGSEDAAATRAHEIGTLAFRLVGIWLIDRALQKSAIILGTFEQFSSPTRFMVVPEIASFALELAFAAVLLIGAGNLAKRSFASRVDDPSPSGGYQRLAFSVLAILILVNAIPDFVRDLLNSGFWTSDVSSTSDYVHSLVAEGLRVALGLLLFVGVAPFIRFWRWIQTAGLDRQSVSQI